jgi:glycosyltransferase involved in cell wall biosynthesis
MGFGGAERNVHEIINKSHNCHGFILVTLNDKIEFEIPYNVELLDISKKNIIVQLIELFVLYKKSKINYTLAFLSKPILFTLFFKFILKIKTVLNERSNPELIYKHNFLKNIIYSYIHRKLYRYSDFLTVNSIGAFKYYQKIIPNYKLFYIKNYQIPNGISKNEILENKLVTVGRLDSKKNVSFLIEVMNLLKNDNYSLDIYGEGPEKEKLIKLVNNYNLNNVVKFCGNSSNIVEKLRDYKFFVFASKVEGCPNVLSEASAIGLPIISLYFNYGVEDIFKNYFDFNNTNKFQIFDNGILVHSNNLHDFESSIKFACKNYKIFYNLRNLECKIPNTYFEDGNVSTYESFLKKLEIYECN